MLPASPLDAHNDEAYDHNDEAYAKSEPTLSPSPMPAIATHCSLGHARARNQAPVDFSVIARSELVVAFANPGVGDAGRAVIKHATHIGATPRIVLRCDADGSVD
jgi:hypothetical protein